MEQLPKESKPKTRSRRSRGKKKQHKINNKYANKQTNKQKYKSNNIKLRVYNFGNHVWDE